MGKALKTGDMIEVYRVPKHCKYWIGDMAKALLNVPGPVTIDTEYFYAKDSVLLNNYWVPRSCVRRVKGDQNGQA